MKRDGSLFLLTITFLLCGFCNAQELHNDSSLDIELYDSLCPGFAQRYNTIRDCKYSSDHSIDESIVVLSEILHHIESQDGLFDDVNYFEAIRLLCEKYLLIGDYRHIDFIVYSTQKYLLENFDIVNNPNSFKDLYKLDRAAAWIEIYEGRYETGRELLEKALAQESDPIENLSVLQDLALCYLLNQQDEEFSEVAKEAVALANKLPMNSYTQGFKITSKRIEAYISIVSNKDMERGIEILEDLANDLENNSDYSRYRCSVLNELSVFYLNDNQIDKYIKIQKELLNNELLSDEERVEIIENLFVKEWLCASDNDVIQHSFLHNSLLTKIAIENLILFPATKNTYIWPEIMESIFKESCLLTRFPDNEEVCGLCYNNQLFLKNPLLSSDYALRRYVYAYGNENQKSLLWEIDTIREFIVYKALNEEFGNLYTVDLMYRESDLMKTLPMESIVRGQIKTWKDVASALREDELAIEVTDCSLVNPQDSVFSQLMALVITKDCTFPRCIKLGNYYEMWDDLKMLFSGDASTINSVYSTPGNSIYRLFWGSLEKQIADKKVVYFSSNTLLSFVNLGALLTADGRRMSEFIDVRLLSSTAEIVSYNDSISCSNAALFGGGAFGRERVNEDDLRSEVIRSINERGDFRELKGTIEEVSAIKNEFENENKTAIVFSGTEATEKSFRALNGNTSQIIHIATHCFSISNMVNSKYMTRLMAIGTRESNMLGTGFLLANSNYSWNNHVENDPCEDGVMLSEDVSRLDLKGCELLVLSGCRSGLGYMDRDGALGLQRAFKRAGVKTMMLSLWDVDDNVTKDFMVCFYKYLLQTNNKNTAYHNAQNEIKEKYKDPYYWASFIMID